MSNLELQAGAPTFLSARVCNSVNNRRQECRRSLWRSLRADRRGLAGCLLLAALLAGPVRGEVGSGVSGLFTVDTRYGFNLGSGVSSLFTVDTRHSAWSGDGFSTLFTVDTRGETTGVGFGVTGQFTVDTRYGFNLGSEVSSFFTVDTRFSGWSGDGFSPLFTLDTRLPLLMLEKTGTNFIFSWFAATAGYQLEVSTNLANPNWSPVTNIPVLSGMQRSVTNPVTGPNQFYRLRKD